MSDHQLSTLQHEWITLQTQFDSYEKYSLVVKLVSIVTCCWLLFGLHAEYWCFAVVAIFWLQDAIWKTFQSRITLRLETVEAGIYNDSNEKHSNPNVVGMQFNLAWAGSRPAAVGLIFEYLKSALKPTVAYPHVVLAFLVGLQGFMS